MSSNHHLNDDGEEQVYEDRERWNGDERRKLASQWDWTPQSATAIIGMLGILGAGIWAFADFRVTLADINARLTTQSERMTKLDDRIENIDQHGSRNFTSTEPVIKNLQKQVDDLRDATKDLNDALLQHNEAMMDLYRKDMADGKRDFRIPSNAPKYHNN